MTYRKTTIICIWHNRFEYSVYLVNGLPKIFGSYTQAWDFIYQNQMPLGASAVELYLPCD